MILLKGYGKNYALDSMLVDLINNKDKIKKITEDHYTLTVHYGNVVIEMWNANKYYSWLSEGKIKNSSNKVIFSWGSSQPSVSTMNKFLKLLKWYYKTKFIQDIQ